MRVESIAEAFDSYRAKVIPSEASPIQIEECRRAFYAGSYALLMNVAHNIGDDSTDEDDGIRQLEALKAECEAFAVSINQPLPTAVLEQSSYNVRNDEVESVLRELAREVKPRIPKGFGFTLLIFSYGAAGSLFYISTANRDDMVKTMREFISRNTQ